MIAGGAFGQGDDAKFSSWSKVEAAPETKAYREAMVAGGAFDAATREFLEQVALPQLALETNRSSIERIRKRLREFLLGGIANEKSADDATKTVASFMESLAAKDDASPVVRVNAMLLIGELQSTDRKPWPPAVTPLARAIANTDLPKAVRIAACVGLAKHVEATKGAVEEQQRVSAVAVPAIMAIFKETTAPETIAADDWMTSHCLTMLPRLSPIQPEVIAEMFRVLGDGNRAVDVRVRAAAAISQTNGAAEQIDAVKAVQLIRELAIKGLELDLQESNKRRFWELTFGKYGAQQEAEFNRQAVGLDPLLKDEMIREQYTARQKAQTKATLEWLEDRRREDFLDDKAKRDAERAALEESNMPSSVWRRAAWRLQVLSNAIKGDKVTTGIVRLLDGDSAANATRISDVLADCADKLAGATYGVMRVGGPSEMIMKITIAMLQRIAD